MRNLTDVTRTLQDTIVYDGFGHITSESNATFGGAYKYAGYRQDVATGQYECLNGSTTKSRAAGTNKTPWRSMRVTPTSIDMWGTQQRCSWIPRYDGR